MINEALRQEQRERIRIRPKFVHPSRPDIIAVNAEPANVPIMTIWPINGSATASSVHRDSLAE
jgi:hypothetical protein